MELTPAQSQIIRDTHRFRVLVCGRKFGKTTTAAEEISACAFSKNGRRVMYMAPTLEDARRLMWERLKNKFKDCIDKSNDTRLELLVPTQEDGKSTIFLGSWEKVDNYRGDEFDFIVFDEAQDYRNFYIGWQESMRPTLTPRKGTALFMGTPKGFNHLYDLFNFQEKESEYKSFHFTTYDNPHIPVEEIEAAKRTLPEDRFAQEYMADFRRMQGLVYKEFDRTKHIYINLPANTIDTSVGVDFGWTNPCAILKIEKDADANYYVTEEWYKTEKTTAEIIEIARSFKGNKYYPDPAEPDRIHEMKQAKLNVREVSKDVEAGINAVREQFKTNKLFIHASCVNLISELETYRYPDKKPDKNEPEIPIKENDHALDALRYVLYMQTTQTNTLAHTYYQPSAQPIHTSPSVAPKIAHTFIQRT